MNLPSVADLSIDCEFPAFDNPEKEGAESALRVRLRADGLLELFFDADQDHRLFELLSLRRPGDAGAYVSVELLSNANTLSARIDEWNPQIGAEPLALGQHISLSAFDEVFGSQGDDTSSAAQHWMRWRGSPECRGYLCSLVDAARTACEELRLESVLAEHVFRQIERVEHDFCFMPLDSAFRHSERRPNLASALLGAFIDKLRTLLTRREINSAVICAETLDSCVVRLVCTEQRRRANLRNLPVQQAFKIQFFLDDDEYIGPLDEWETAVWLIGEGRPQGDLCIDLGSKGKPVAFWMARQPCRIALCTMDSGEHDGYVRSQGDGWTMYRMAADEPEPDDGGPEQVDKRERYELLVSERKKCALCVPHNLTNPNAQSLRHFDGAEIGPWTRWQGDLDARLMIVGQDWGGVPSFVRQGGWNLDSETNRFLRGLLKSVLVDVDAPEPFMPVNRNGVFATNAALCLKAAGDSSHVRAPCFRNCRSAFLKPQIEIVQPLVVVCLGLEAYSATMNAFGLPPERTLRDAVESQLRVRILAETEIVPVFHCSRQGQRTRSIEQQTLDWQRVARALRTG